MHVSHYSFAVSTGPIFALSCSPITQTSPVSALLISHLTSASFLPTCTSSLTMSTSEPIGAARTYFSANDRDTLPGWSSARRTVLVSTSTSVAAHPPCNVPSLLHSSGATVIRKVTCVGGPRLADSKRTWSRMNMSYDCVERSLSACHGLRCVVYLVYHRSEDENEPRHHRSTTPG